MKKNIFLLKGHLSALVLIFGLLVHSNSFAGTQMPSFSLEGVSEDTLITSESLEGDVVLVSFFATWCPPCVQEIPGFITLTNEFADDDFTLLAVSVDQGGSKVVTEFMQQHDINYTVALATQKILQDFGGVYGIPVSFLVNKEGDVVKRYTGYVPHNLLSKEIKSLL